MPAVYRFKGVPRTFTTKAAALAFLRNSPNYVSRKQKYLETYWPGLLAEVKGAVSNKPARTRGQLAATALADMKSSGPGLFDTIGSTGAKVGKAAKRWAEDQVEQTVGTALYGGRDTNRTSKVPARVQHASRVAEKVVPSPHTVEAVGDLTLGKGLTNLAQGQPPKNWQDVAGLGFGVAAMVPTGGGGVRAGRALKAALGAEKTADKAVDVGKVASAATKLPTPSPDDVVQQLRGGLRGARAARKAQEAGYSAERAKRFAMFEQAVRADPTAEGFERAKGLLKGALPKLGYEGFGELDQAAMNALVKRIVEHPNLMSGQRINVIEGLKLAANGSVPTPSQLTLIEHVFGKNVADNLSDLANLSAFGHIKEMGYEILNVPRAIMATFDFSAVLRQGLVMGTRHPVIAARNIRPMLRMWKSQKMYDEVLTAVKESPNFPLYHEMKLAITELGPLSTREERFYSNVAEKIVPGVKMSSRAYNGYLVKFRADTADHLLARFAADGVNVHDPELLASLGKFINSATGRGSLGAFEGSAKVLNTFFFSPRLMASRFNFLWPGFYMGMHPAVRKEALRAALHTVGTVSAVLALASYAGAKVGRDPRNADFAKIRIGNTRLDIAAGYQQPVRLLGQLGTGVIISSTTGKRLDLTEGGFGQSTRKDITQRFFEGKLAPPISLLNDWAKGKDFQGYPFEWGPAIKSRMIPLLAQDSYDLYREREGGMDGITAAMLGYGIGMWGVGTQTYGGRPAPSSTKRGKPGAKPGSRLSNKPGGRLSNKPSRRRSNKP